MPTEGNPQFHQQMVYAVAMTTIRNFERALGRPALWAPRPWREGTEKPADNAFVQRLRIYPHALREARVIRLDSPLEESIATAGKALRSDDAQRFKDALTETDLYYECRFPL